jgi:hypothetical protein
MGSPGGSPGVSWGVSWGIQVVFARKRQSASVSDETAAMNVLKRLSGCRLRAGWICTGSGSGGLRESTGCFSLVQQDCA